MNHYISIVEIQRNNLFLNTEITREESFIVNHSNILIKLKKKNLCLVPIQS